MARFIPCAAVSAGAVLALGACAPNTEGAPAGPTAQSAAAACFYPDQVRSFRSRDGTNIYFDAGRGRIYHAVASGTCQDLDFAMTLTIRADSAGTSRLCAGDWARLQVRGGGRVNGPCRVRIVKALSAAEAAALPQGDRP